MKKKKLILALIKDDLISIKLVEGLNAIGLNADTYLLHLSGTIFKLLDIEDTLTNEPIYEFYLELTKRVKYIDISESHASLDDLAKEIYEELMLRRPLR